MKSYRGAEAQCVVETCFHKNWEAEEPGGVQLLPTLHDRAGLVSRALPTSAPRPFFGPGESSPVCSASSMLIAAALGMPTLSHTKLASHTTENTDLEIQRSSNLPFFPGWNLTALERSQGGKQQQLREKRAHNPERQHHSWHEKMPVKFSIWLTACIIIFPTASWITLMFSLWWRTVLVTLKWLVEQCVNLINLIKMQKHSKKVPNNISKFNKKYTGHRGHSNLIDLENNQRRRNAEDN